MRAIYTIRYFDPVNWDYVSAKIIAKSWTDALRTLKNSKAKYPYNNKDLTIWHNLLENSPASDKYRPELISKQVLPDISYVLEIGD